MEYWISKLYNKQCDKETPVIKYSGVTKAILKVCAIFVLYGVAELILSMCFKWPRGVMIISAGLILGAIVAAFIVIDRGNKTELEESVKNYKCRLKILEAILEQELKIVDKDNIMLLIEKYRAYITRREKEVENAQKMLLYFLSAVGAVVSVSFVNMHLLKMSFVYWAVAITALCIPVIVFIVIFYFGEKIDPQIKKYRKMIGMLEDLLIIKY